MDDRDDELDWRLSVRLRLRVDPAEVIIPLGLLLVHPDNITTTNWRGEA